MGLLTVNSELNKNKRLISINFFKNVNRFALPGPGAKMRSTNELAQKMHNNRTIKYSGCRYVLETQTRAGNSTPQHIIKNYEKHLIRLKGISTN